MRPLSFVAMLVVLAPPATAFAANTEAPLRLSWKAPEGCPSADAVREAALRNVDASRGKKPDVLEAAAQVEQRPSASGDAGWHVLLRTHRGASTGEREIDAATCSGLADATAVVLALALVPEAPANPEHEAIATPLSPAVGDHSFAVGVSMAGDASTLPSPAVGGSLTVAWTPGRIRLEADARRWGSQSGRLSGADTGARFTMTSLGGRACLAAWKTTQFDLSPCAGADANLVSAAGFGADTNYSRNTAWAAVAGGVLARAALGSWLALRTRIEAVAPISRPTFVVENEGAVHRTAAFGAAASLGLETHFL